MAFPRRSPLRPLLAIAIFSLGACGDSGPSGPDPEDAIASVTVSPTQATVDVGSTTHLTATVKNGRGESMSTAVTWASATPGVGTVDNSGTVTGVTEGTTSVTASAGGYSGSATVTVNDPFPPTAPSNVVATPVSNTAVQVTWTDNSLNEDEFRVDREEVMVGVSGGVTGTDVGLSLAFAQVGTVGTNGTTFSDTGLQPGTAYNYRVRACNENGCSDPVADPDPVTTYTELVIGTTTLPTGWASEAYLQTLSATGGGGGVVWSLSDGALPSGITLSEAGVLGGTPSAVGTFGFTVQAVGGGQTVTQLLSLEIYDQVMVSTANPPNGVMGVGYNIGLAAFGGDGSYAWTLSAGDLPPGLDLSDEGRLTGTPTALGSYAFTVEVTSAGRTATGQMAVNVYTPLSITTPALPQGTSGTAYSTTLQGAGGQPPYLWSVSAGALPSGLSLAEATGVLSGTPAAGGTFPFTIQLASSDGQSVTADLSLTVTFIFACTSQSEIPQAECQALEALYNETNGPGWTDSSNWLADSSPCGWYGVNCAEGSVIQLKLAANGLSGPIPPELGNLSRMGNIHLHANDLTGSIPATFGQLSNLGRLFLSNNELTGPIPPEIGNLIDLKELSLDFNDLSGPIPTEIGDLTELTHLNLQGNQLTGTIPSGIGNLTKLFALHLERNQLTGTIPSELGNLPELALLYLDVNQLTGPIPQELGNLPDLEVLELDDNGLTGAIPSQLGNLPKLWKLDLSYNQLSGPIPPEIGDLPDLTTLRLRANQLSGSIPSDLGDMPSLWSLNLSDNQLTGAIPPELGSLSTLVYLYLDGNQLTGAIPPELGDLSALEGLDLASNQLGTTVPLAVAQLGGQIQSAFGVSRCEFLPGNTGLSLPDTQAYRDADLDGDGFICRVMFPPVPAEVR